jgi:putative hydrolase of the HAD superfamily
VKPALLFDLDETLIVEEPAAVAAFEATAQFAASRCEVDPASLATGARLRARELWYAAPTHEYCKQVGISSWEGLWCRFVGDGPDECLLREWSPAYRQEAWSLALADQGVADPRLADELGELFGVERRARHEVFADAEGTLAELKESHSLALVTNGAACLQREKLAASGLGGYFDAVVVSADIGAAKPDASVFERALSQLGAERESAVMVGDSLIKDIDGAIAAGLGAIWVNRTGAPAPSNREGLLVITTLEELPSALSISTSKEAPPPDS